MVTAREVNVNTCQAVFTVFIATGNASALIDYQRRLTAARGVEAVQYMNEHVSAIDGSIVHEVRVFAKENLSPVELSDTYFDIGTILRF